MSAEYPLESEKLVQVYRARDEWQGHLLVGYLRDNGVEATLRQRASIPPCDSVEFGDKRTDGILVLQHDAERARGLVQEFLVASPDEEAMDALAGQKLHVTKERFAQLRAALWEEKQTFRMLGWGVLLFILILILLWQTLPWHMKGEPPPRIRPYRGTTVGGAPI